MADDTESVEFELDVRDKASPKLTKLEKNIGKVGGAVDRASSNFVGMIKQSAMMGAFFALGPAIAGAKNYIAHVDKITKVTGMAGDRAAGISNSLQGAGVDAGEVENIFNKLGKAGAKMSEGQKGMAKLAKGYGVELKGGPEQSLLNMSKAIDEGRLGTQGIARVLNISAEQAAKLRNALEKGPKAAKAEFDALAKKNAAFNDEGLEGISRWHDASTRVGLAWNRMTAGIMIKLAPALEKLSLKFESGIEGWAAGAEKFGKFLVEHMEKIVALAKVYAKLMIVNTVAQKLTGKGVVGLAGGAYGVLSKRMAARAAAGAAGAGGKDLISRLAAPIISLFTTVFKGMTSFRPIISGLLKLAPIGGVIMVVVAAVKALSENFNGITTRLKTTFGGIFKTIASIGGKLASMFGEDSALGKLMGGIGYAFLETVNAIGEMIGFVLRMVEKIVDLIPNLFKSGGASIEGVLEAQNYVKAQRKRIAKLPVAEQEAALRNMQAFAKKLAMGEAPSQKAFTRKEEVRKPTPKDLVSKEEPQVNMNFPNARFDIKQAFAEGYDPDRIATAFTNEIASLGERKLQSGFSPLFTVR